MNKLKKFFRKCGLQISIGLISLMPLTGLYNIWTNDTMLGFKVMGTGLVLAMCGGVLLGCWIGDDISRAGEE